MGIDSTRAPVGATTLSTNDDAAIIAAFDRRAVAFAALGGLPDPAISGSSSTPEQAAQWAIIDAAEAEICATVATTARGAELQLWTAAVYQFDAAEDEGPCFNANLDHFTAQGDKLDWKDRLFIAALQSLRAMGGAA